MISRNFLVSSASVRDLIGTPQVGDVVQDEHRAATAAARDRRGTRDERAAGVARQRELAAVGFLAAQCGAKLLRDVGMSNDFHVGPSDGRRVHAQHPLRRAVGDLDASVDVQHEHAFDHPRQDRIEPRAIARQLVEPSSQFVDGSVERARDVAELVRPVVVGRTSQVPLAVSLRDIRDSTYTPAQDRGGEPCDGQRERDGQHERQRRLAADATNLLRDGRQRQRDAHIPHARMTRGHGGVQHLYADGGAVPRDDPHATSLRLLHFGALQMVFDVGERLAVEIRIAEDAAIHPDQRNSRGRQLRETIGFVIEILAGRYRGITREELGDDLRLADEAHFDDIAFVLAPLVGDDERQEGERRGRDANRRQEDLRAKAEGHVTSLSASL